MEQQQNKLTACDATQPRTLTLSQAYSNVATVGDVLAMQQRGEVASFALKAREAAEATKQGIRAVFSAFAAEMADSVNKTLTEAEIDVIAEAVLDPSEGLAFLTVADLIVFFKQVRRGRWQDYERINSMKICRWLHEYADERIAIAERQAQADAARFKEQTQRDYSLESMGYAVRKVVVDGKEYQQLAVLPSAVYSPKKNDKYLTENELAEERKRQLAALGEKENTSV